MLPKHIIICHNKMEIGFDYILSHQTKIDGDFFESETVATKQLPT